MTDREMSNRARVHDARKAKQARQFEYERAVKADMVAFIMQAYCPKGQGVPYDVLEKLYQKLRLGIE